MKNLWNTNPPLKTSAPFEQPLPPTPLILKFYKPPSPILKILKKALTCPGVEAMQV